ncbi:MAG TPA: endonuclease III [Nitrososphaeraceae archaeon]|nr:endonuclease III [Nitrososphaeraceae archaeon]
MDTIDIIIEKMEQVVRRQRQLPRITALKRLQLEEQDNPFKILIGTILSARTRDENTTKAVSTLFRKYKNAKELAEADIAEIRAIIRSVGFYNVKATAIKEVSKLIVEKFNGNVPHDIVHLLQLPRVGRKTANCVLVYGFNREAIPVDVHVHRISNRLGLVDTKTPEQTEIDLSRAIDRKHWLKINQTFVMYGQNICTPVKPKCKLCDLKNMCKFYQTLSNIDSNTCLSS